MPTQAQQLAAEVGIGFTPAVCGDPAVLGCTDPNAANYNPAATQDDGSCVYPEICSLDFSNNGGDAGFSETYPITATGYTLYAAFDAEAIPDRLKITSNLGTLWDTGCIGTQLGGTGHAYQAIPIASGTTQITVQVIPNCSGPTINTLWVAKLRCSPITPIVTSVVCGDLTASATGQVLVYGIDGSSFVESVAISDAPAGWSLAYPTEYGRPVLTYNATGMSSGTYGSFTLTATNPFGSTVATATYHVA